MTLERRLSKIREYIQALHKRWHFHISKRHSMLSGHSDLTMDDEEPIHAIEENDQAPIVSAGEFLKLPFVTDDE